MLCYEEFFIADGICGRDCSTQHMCSPRGEMGQDDVWGADRVHFSRRYAVENVVREKKGVAMRFGIP